jgi:endonuclease/exonuclease/phosphatase family metal-dependent hydrolase
MTLSADGTLQDGRVLIGPVDAPELHVMTYNIRRLFRRYRPGSPDRWADREPLIAALLRREQPALLGTQEAMPTQGRAVSRALGPHYRRQVALSDTPAVAGSRSWGNMVPRIAVVADFTDLATGLPLRHVNTHFDHLSRRSREASARMMLEIVAEVQVPTIVAGDTNAGVETEAHRLLVESGALVDAWDGARDRLTPEWGTWSNYKAPKRTTRRIDWMLVTPDVEVERVGINTTRTAGRAPSDHEALQAVVRC